MFNRRRITVTKKTKSVVNFNQKIPCFSADPLLEISPIPPPERTPELK